MYMFELHAEFQQAARLEAQKAVGYVLAMREEQPHANSGEQKVFPVTPTFLEAVCTGIQVAIQERTKHSGLQLPEKLTLQGLYGEYIELTKDVLRETPGIKPVFLIPES